jgi:DNA-binding beta-propeller fold protein YncE
MIIFDREGNFIATWGEGSFKRPHELTMDGEDNLYLVDDFDHTIRKTTAEGKVLMVLGTPGKPAPAHKGGIFNRPTHVAVHPVTGDLFVSDGYGNSHIHKFDKHGKHIKTWGGSGSDPGQFSLPHSICMAGEDRLMVCDRENFRMQMFTTEGEFVKEWHMHRPMGLDIGKGADTSIYVGEAGAPPVMAGVPNLGQRIKILGRDGKEITRFGNPKAGEGLDQFLAPHSVAVDSHGDVYVAEVSYTAYGSQLDPPREVVSLRKWRRVEG